MGHENHKARLERRRPGRLGMTEMPNSDEAAFEKEKQAVITVGGGRGFVVEGDLERRYVITAAHCLPLLPPAHGASKAEERTYQNLLGLLGKEPSVCAECVFADPVADVAVLSEPDGHELSDEWETYGELTEKAGAIPIADTPRPSVESHWLCFHASVQHRSRGSRAPQRRSGTSMACLVQVADLEDHQKTQARRGTQLSTMC
jgi:hypothetical protein